MLLASLSNGDVVEAISDPGEVIRLRSFSGNTVVKIRVQLVLSRRLWKLLACGVKVLLGILGIGQDISLALDDKHRSSQSVRASAVVSLLPIDEVGVLDPASVLVELLDG
ncbi:hypothetical protein HG530_012417 [Fusarium avenaceum]|nr:hypothetical protein HG530_012417 [Fusarium avenaceum]